MSNTPEGNDDPLLAFLRLQIEAIKRADERCLACDTRIGDHKGFNDNTLGPNSCSQGQIGIVRAMLGEIVPGDGLREAIGDILYYNLIAHMKIHDPDGFNDLLNHAIALSGGEQPTEG